MMPSFFLPKGIAATVAAGIVSFGATAQAADLLTNNNGIIVSSL